MVTLNMESRNSMGCVYAENRSKTQKPLGFKGLNPTATCVSSDSSDDESDVEITGESTGNLDKTGALGALNDSHYEIINLPSGWLDCAIIQQAQILLKKANPLIESFQRTTLGPIRNFDIVTSEFIQYFILGTCTGSV